MAQEGALPRIKSALEEKGSICEYVRQSDSTTATAGRSAVYLFRETDGVNWVVRHLTHGGLLGRFTGDRFARSDLPRPFNELIVAHSLRECGVATPLVVAACVFDSRFCYRGEIVREEVAGARDLAEILYGRPEGEKTRLPAMAAAGALVGQFHRAGLIHTDLNLKNILINATDGHMRAHIIDLEKSRLSSHLGTRNRNSMLVRMRRSASRFEERGNRALLSSDWKAFDDEYARAFNASR
jgi:3-deoxy-D-manno-octulosonic acid kinase